MIAAWTNHLWQSTLFAIVAALLAIALRRNSAQIRYWLWFTASLKFLVPFSLLTSLGSQLAWPPVAPRSSTQVAAQSLSSAVAQITQPFSATAPYAQPPQAAPDWAPILVFCIWASGFAAIAIVRFRGWLCIRSALKSSNAIELAVPMEVRSSPGLLEPGVVGLLRPILLLPEGIVDRLTPPQLNAVLAHELCHVRRRDNLLASIHMIVEAIFWFHPLAWWIGSRLIDERERACDEEVLRLGIEPHVYAEGILNVCKLYVESPLRCVSGVTGSNLKARIEDIMKNRCTLRLNFAKKTILVLAGAAALAIPFIAGVFNAPPIRAQAPSNLGDRPQFEVVSVKPVETCRHADGVPPPPPGRKTGGPADKPIPASALGVSNAPSPGTVTHCGNLEKLIRTAYVHFANGQLPNQERYANAVPIVGGPAWVQSDLYQITGEAQGAPNPLMMRGPMMQTLLESRFKLKVHRETRESPAYELTVAPGGPRLQPFQEGSCVPTTVPPARVNLGQKECVNSLGKNGANATFHRQAVTLGDLSTFLFVVTDRPVIDRTGINGRFDIHLEYVPDQATPGGVQMLAVANGRAPGAATVSEPANGLSLFSAVQQQLGLNLRPVNALRDYLVIDYMEQP